MLIKRTLLFIAFAGLLTCGCLQHRINQTPPVELFNEQFQKAIVEFHQGNYSESTEILTDLSSEIPDFSQNPDILYLLAMNYYMEKNWEKAVSTWEAYLAKPNELADYGLYFLADSLAQQGDYYLAKETLNTLLTSYPDSRYAEPAKIRGAEYLVMMGNVEEGLKQYKNLKNTISANLLPELLTSQANSFEFLERFQEAIDTYLEIYVNFPNDTNAILAKQKIDALAERINFELSPQKVIERINNLFNRAEYSLALKEIEDTDIAKLDRAQTERYLYLKALAEYNLRYYNRALTTIEKCRSINCENADLFFLKGKILSRLGKNDEAKRNFSKLIADYPSSEWVDNAYYKLAALSYLENNYSEAIANINKVLNEFPESDAIIDALWAKVWYSFRAGKSDDAISALKALSLRKDIDSLQSLSVRYWLARILENTDRTTSELIYNEIIMNSTPPNFYTLLSLMRIGKTIPPVQLEPFVSNLKFSQYKDNMFHLEHAKKLAFLGFTSDVEIELKLAEKETRSDVDKLLLVGNYYLSTGLYYDAIMLSKIYLSEYINRIDNFSSEAAELAYPRGYRQLVEEYSKKYNIDPNLIYAVVLAESMFKKDSISRANAIGLMQIIPLTGQYVASLAGLRDFKPEMLMDPDINLGLGIKYLSTLNQQYSGNLVLMLAHYNAGPTNLNSWLSRKDPQEVDIFIENIPFNETREYIKKVISYYCYYSWLYGGNIDIQRIFGISNEIHSTESP